MLVCLNYNGHQKGLCTFLLREKKRWVHLAFFLIFLAAFSCEQQIADSSNREITQASKIEINTARGHALETGLSGFNVRIADKVWSYHHPDFIAAVDTLRPGWLRYFSGTMGDAFNSATGLYDYDYIYQFDRQKKYKKGFQFTAVKGPHTILDLYHVLARVNGKLVVTINGFTETPAKAAELARFCKNNHIQVEAWQFCNEPYFYVPNRDRYWWNDGEDYAAKMKPFADSIRSVFPDAKLALNFTWDGIWKFMKEIKSYQDTYDRYWDVFSKHSYAPHVGHTEDYHNAYRRANTKLLEATSSHQMEMIEQWSWKDAPLMITEFGVWNSSLNGIYASIYNAEYMLRQIAHPNVFLIGPHEISNKAVPMKRRAKEVLEAYEKGMAINTDTLSTGFMLTGEGKAMYLLHLATNDTDYTYETELSGGPFVPGLDSTLEQGWYARSFRGLGDADYLMITNRSAESIHPEIFLDGEELSKDFIGWQIVSGSTRKSVSDIQSLSAHSNDLVINPFSVVLLKWTKKHTTPPPATRIYKSVAQQKGIELFWWKMKTATAYRVIIADDLGNKEEIKVAGHLNNFRYEKAVKGRSYWFEIIAENEHGKSEVSAKIRQDYMIPAVPEIFETSRRNNAVTILWRSVPNATGYKVYVKDQQGNIRMEDAGNIFGYRMRNLTYEAEYDFTVTAYNGLGESDTSLSASVTPSRKVPIPPRNLSAHGTKEGYVNLKWIAQDSIHENVTYNIYRGKHPFQYEVLATGIKGQAYIDRVPDPAFPYYSIKSQNDKIETNYYSNCATVIRSENQLSLEVAEITENEDNYLIKVTYKNFPTDGISKFGVAISNLSFLNQDEEIIYSEKIEATFFTVKIDKERIKENNTYSVRAMIITNGSPYYSSSPHKKINSGKIAG